MDKKIMVMIPCMENIYPDTQKCVWDLWKNADNYEIDFDYIHGHSVDRARNLCVRHAIREGATHILFVDNDTTFNPEFLNNLLEHDVEVVMGYYDHRNYDPNDKLRTNLCKLGQEHYIEQVTPEEMNEAREEGYDLVQVKGGGLGFCLIDLRIFEGLPYPWFVFREYKDGFVLSEDLYFAELCRQFGIPIYADTRCYCGHIFRKRHGGYETVHKD